MNRRVAITGMGLVTALGASAGETWRNLVAGRSAARPLTMFDVTTCRGQTAASVDRLDLPEGVLDAKQRRYLDRAGKLLLIAGHEALTQAKFPGGRAMLVLGTTGGGMRSGELFHRQALARQRDATTPRLLQNYTAQQQALDFQRAFRVEGPVLITANACATGSNAVGYGLHLVRSGQWDTVLCAGYDALSELIYAGFDSLQAMTTSLCRPFDKNRNGLVLGEGAAVLVLESADHARQRGATILGEVAGYGQSIDTHHLTQPHPEGDGALLCMRRAIESAGLRVEDIDHINAHGTATPQNDAMEAKAIRRCFGERADTIPVTSVKGAIGHLLGGAGAAEAVIGVLSLQHQTVPPTIHYETPDPACPVSIVANTARAHPMRAVLSNSFGFGGANAAVVFRKWSDATLS